MAWEWSHSPEAYANAHDNLSEMPHKWLVVCLAEIKATSGEFNDQFDLDTFNSEAARLKGLPGDILADAIWEFASNHATCDNGGFNAHMCPYGCHTVSFSRDQDGERIQPPAHHLRT